MDVVVLGDGPAGAAAAAAIAGEGLRTLLVSRAPESPWTNVYGAWLDELERAGFGAVAGRVWRDALVFIDDEPIHLGRAYARLDNGRLRGRLRDALARAGGEVEAGEAVAIEHTSDRSRVVFADGRTIEARLVVDCTGAGSRFVERRSTPPAAQVAYGLLGRAVHRPRWAHDDVVVLMDFRSDHLDPVEQAAPSFLYALPLEGGRLFVEETSLVARPPMHLAALEARLAKRLGHLGLELAVEEVERCFIPMGLQRPALHQRVVAFGAAAGMVHPATGYMVRDALARAPALAAAVRDALARHTEDPGAAARAVWRGIWPAARRRAWALYELGMDVLVDLDAPGTRTFFRAFFALPPEDWRAFLSGDLAPGALVGVMGKVFRSAPPALRLVLARHGLTHAARVLF